MVLIEGLAATIAASLFAFVFLSWRAPVLDEMGRRED